MTDRVFKAAVMGLLMDAGYAVPESNVALLDVVRRMKDDRDAAEGALKAYDGYMVASGYDGPESEGLHPWAAAVWERARYIIGKVEGRG